MHSKFILSHSLWHYKYIILIPFYVLFYDVFNAFLSELSLICELFLLLKWMF
jgi:hypothetical protein